mmetsp:Transcript_24487/g.70579  ORF Transcript_24487/g.70579 Transcript_24487/m.70579 type:complete len:835 (-) Transcript_24487:2276-4780(-)
MPTLKQRKYSQASTSTSAGGAGGAGVARRPGRDRAPPRQPDHQADQLQPSARSQWERGGQPPPPRQDQLQPPPPQDGADAQAQRLQEQQRVVDAMQEMQMDEVDLGVPPGGPLQVEPWPPLLQQRPLPRPLPPQQHRVDPLLSIARMERCSRCHLRTWSFNQDPVTGALRTNALTINGEVYKGRCLLCFPLPNGFAGAASSVISNDDNGSDHGGRPRAVDGPGPGSRGATTRVAAEAAATASVADPIDSVRVDVPDDSSRRGKSSDIAEEQGLVCEQPDEQQENGLNSSQESIEIAHASSKSDSDAAAAPAATGESESTDTATSKPTDDSAPSAGLKGGRGSRKRRKDDETVKDAESNRGVKRSSLRSRSPSRPRPSSAGAGAGAGTSTGGRRRSPKRRQNPKAPTSEEKIKAAISELSGESCKVKSQVRCLKRLLSLCRTAGTPEKEDQIVSRIVRLRGVEAILSLMKSSSCEVLRYCCETLLYVCYYDTDITMQLRVHDVMKNTLVAYPNDATLVQVLIGVLQQCADNDSAIDSELIAGGCLDQVIFAATSNRSMPKIQLNSCLFLQDLTSELTDRTDVKRVLKSGALDCAMQAVKRNWKNDAIVLAGLATITNIFQEEVDSRSNRHAFEGLKSILLNRIMKPSMSASVVAQCLSVLCNISIEGVGVNKLIVESGFIARTTAMMGAFRESLEVQRNGCLFLRSIAHGKRKVRATDVVEGGGIEAIVYCLDAHCDNAEVVAAALGALRNINHPADHSCTVSSVVDHILKALQMHNNDQEIASHCCQLFLQYIQFPLVAKKLKAKKCSNLLKKAAREHPDSCRQAVDRINAKLL